MKPLVVANWKCNPKSLAEAKRLFNSIKKGVQKNKKADIVICPSFVYLSLLKGLVIGAQNCFHEPEGAYTGEISSPMLKDSGCKYVIVGHSERRKYFAETNDKVNKKLKAILKENLIPIFCVGETKEQREKGETENILKEQLEKGLKEVSGFRFQGLGIIAYEPVWAIGTGNPCDIDESQRMLLLIRKVLSKIYNQALSRKIPILYGGSVKSDNAKGYIKEAGFNGLLVGGASLKADEFIKIVKETI